MDSKKNKKGNTAKTSKSSSPDKKRKLKTKHEGDAKKFAFINSGLWVDPISEEGDSEEFKF